MAPPLPCADGCVVADATDGGDGAGSGDAQAQPDTPLADSVLPNLDALLPDQPPGADSQVDTPPVSDAMDTPDAADGVDVASSTEPWAPCSTGAPDCPGQGEQCVLYPDGSGKGVCMKPCSAEGAACPPGQSCVSDGPDDPGEPGGSFCVKVSGLLEQCGLAVGSACGKGLTCIGSEVEQKGVCTLYCMPKQNICPPATACLPAGGVAGGDTFACLHAPVLSPCGQWGECAESSVCAAVVEWLTLCVPACDEKGTACESSDGMCEQMDGPAGPVSGCVHREAQGVPCDEQAGWVCEDGLLCLDTGAADGLGRCAAPCSSGADCPAYMVCGSGEHLGEPAKACVVPSLAASPLEPCSDSYPCKEEGKECSGAWDGSGLCAPSCVGGCAEGLACLDGGCFSVSAAGGPCAPEHGLLCGGGAQCLLDEASGSGICAAPCEPSGPPCPDETQVCQDAGQSGSFCLAAAGFGEQCALSQGVGCDSAAGLVCMAFSGEGSQGFCTAKCDGFFTGVCPDGPPGSNPECVFSVGGQTFCGFLCGSLGGECPEGLKCDSDVCLP